MMSRGIFHKDLKPENIYIYEEYPIQIKVGDFGTAQIIKFSEEEIMNSSKISMIGTPFFCSPEIFSDD